MPKPSTSRPGAAGAARHREHIGHRVVRRQFVTWYPVGEDHVVRHAEAVRQPAQGRTVRAAADDDQGGAVDALADRRQCPDQHVLALARHQARHADHDRPLTEVVAGTQFGTGHLVGHEPIGVHARR